MSFLRRSPHEVCSVWPDPLELSEMPDLEWGDPPAQAYAAAEPAQDDVQTSTPAPELRGGGAALEAGWLPWEHDGSPVVPASAGRSWRGPVVGAVAGVSAVAAGLLAFSAPERRAPRLRPAARPGRPGPTRVVAKLWQPTPSAVARYGHPVPRVARAVAPRRPPATESARRRPALSAGAPALPAASSVPRLRAPLPRRAPAVPAASPASPPAGSREEFAFEARG